LESAVCRKQTPYEEYVNVNYRRGRVLMQGIAGIAKLNDQKHRSDARLHVDGLLPSNLDDAWLGESRGTTL
jgi:hypothetical protein